MDNLAVIIINIVAIILSPVLAVIITQRLQDRAKKREDKLTIFKTLMANRHYGWINRDSVYALNIIDIVFSNSSNVREKWALYHEYMSRPSESISMSTSNIKSTELLEAIAEDLGYKGKVTWVTVQNSYMPKGYSDYLNNEAQYYKAQYQIAGFVDKITSMLNSPTLGKDIIKSLLNDIGNALSELFSSFSQNSSDVPSDESIEKSVFESDGEVKQEE